MAAEIADIYPSALLPILSPVITAIASANLVFLGWLYQSFQKFRVELREQEQQLNKHHLENLRRFEKISVALAKLGATNGTYGLHHE